MAALSAAISVGLVAGGVSIGVSIAHNYIGFKSNGTAQANEVHAYMSGSSATAAGALTIGAHESATIHAEVVAASAAVGAGLVGIAAAAAGASDDQQGRHVGQGLHRRRRRERHHGRQRRHRGRRHRRDHRPDRRRVARRCDRPFAAGTIAIGIALAENDVTNLVEAYIKSADQGVTTTSGHVSVSATSGATISSTTGAAAAAVALSFGPGISIAVAGAGASALNVILTSTKAHIDSSVVHSFGDVSIDAATRPRSPRSS